MTEVGGGGANAGNNREPGAVPDGKGPEDECVHYAEDGGVYADAECERENGRDGEAGAVTHHSEAVANILAKHLEVRPAPHITRDLPYECSVTRLTAGDSSAAWVAPCNF